ncbi:MAG TPA: porin [Azonexus sp.]|nr:porin [Azonexus sp.]
MKKHLIAAALSALCTAGAWAAEPTLEEKFQILQNELDALKAQMAKMAKSAPAPAAANSSPAVADSSSSSSNLGPATTIGGYGELNYNHYNNNGKNSEADLRRFVLFFGHRFNDNLRFVSELELEHGVTSRDDAGEVEIEQAYLDYRFNDAVNVKAGLFLIPLGLLNETHEPPTYYGVERNSVETLIIPSTWREGGIGVHGEVAPGLRYDVGITTGFNSGKMDDPAEGFRSGHQEMTQSRAHDLSMYAALNYRGLPGLLVGGGIFSGNTGQNGFVDRTTPQNSLAGVNARLTLWDVHAKYNVGRLDLQALYAKGTLGDANAVSAEAVAQGHDGAIPKSIYGWYGQAAYHVWQRGDYDLAPFIRYEKYNTQQKVADGFTADPLNDERVITAGVNFRLHPQVVVKADVQKYKADSSKDRINLGVGYMF